MPAARIFTRFSPTLINEFRTGWHTFFEGEVFGTTNDPAYDVAGKMHSPAGVPAS